MTLSQHLSGRRSIAIVRHGETDWNLARRIQGRTEVPLNATGREQARTAARLLAAGPGWSGLSSSPMLRAIETAEILSGALGLGDPYIDHALWERDFGPAEGLLVAEAERRWPGLDIPGAETLDALAERAAAGLLRTLEEAPGTVVVAHGALIRSGLTRIGGAPLPRILNCEVWILSRDGGSAPRLARLEPAAV
ncbi:histidine phosphatase family protein [Leucobacter weissii]|uniref:Histidine phosphatase family protein n=1 Tax=Leucobacter weissii TaxID=1983706 RepID=A0A939S9G4_9MICO|nr:histidine phosphatase family protein [Leucobacter weissii]